MEVFTDKMIGYMAGGAIIGDDANIWNATPGFAVSSSELQSFVDIFKPNSEYIYKGISFHGEVYSVSSVFDGIAKAKSNQSGLIIAKCPTCLIIGYYDDLSTMKTCNQAVEKLQELITNNTNEKGIIKLDY
ncbi:hypothetical protein TVAG_429000 [Trichomonas vaginalis G3]|uniref:Profilin n=1 Tax=Trichomonas vaginalis (strain ATCC PRA-98 / G3) TaxID=412133 RepID=A2FMB4_TRIV3|nr:profilin family [Trichomonas vaginalis G3]EAX93970.1 hypothetical protein TVAG_429000 [Trichomonas vaginalis G3]KAI5500942.1 profilin family [Trichomonas vaginalis G3]|eukprot:XP_001306900.1 hypothetical protein [Trichomonas vaginalis G3]